MEPQNTPEPRSWDDLAERALAGDREGVTGIVDRLPAGDAARAIAQLDPEMMAMVLALLEAERAAELIELLPDAHAADLVEHLRPADAAAILSELPSNQQADLLTEMPIESAEAILSAMEPDDAAGARRLVRYPEDVAGGLMITEYLAYPLDATTGDVVADLRANAERYADYDVQYVYVVSPFGELHGVLRLRDLLLTGGTVPLERIMHRQPLSVNVHTPLDALRGFFDEHDYFGVPVLDDDRRLVGVVRKHDVEESLGERADSDYMKSLGILGGEELRVMPFAQRYKGRFAWLSINLGLKLCAGVVISAYEETLQAAIALAVFLPIISDMSGCAGNQALAVSMRELSLGLVRPIDVVRVFLKEVWLGVALGIVLGLMISIIGLIWKDNAWVGIVVGTALALNTIIAVIVGGTLPLLVKRLGFDPALASVPILTTVSDVGGFLLVLSFASAVLPQLTGEG